MSEEQTVAVRFPGEVISTYRSAVAVYTLFRTPEGLYRVHTDDGDQAWLESGCASEGLSERKVRALWPELVEAAGL
jgi:hypothetical protein